MIAAAAIQLIVLMAVFTILESRWPSAPRHKWWRRPLLVDLCSWLVHPLSMSIGITLASFSTNALLAQFFKHGAWQNFSTLRADVAAFTPFIQIPIAVLIADFLAYWIHRAYHRFPVLWAFHIVHHTSEELDWLSTSRLHPVSQILNTAATGIALLLIGLPVTAVVVANVLIGAAALLVHANVNWTFGPLQHLFVSPLLHQWHHARAEDDTPHQHSANYGAIFSVWDRMFGTWSLPALKRPAHFGVKDSPAPTLVGLALFPFRFCADFFAIKTNKDLRKSNPKVGYIAHIRAINKKSKTGLSKS